MNWGHKITIVISLFIIGMLGMVYVASKQTNEMMDEKYYEKELAYQGVIDAKNNLANYTISSIVSQNDSTIVLTIPISIIKDTSNGTVDFLRIENKAKDIHLALRTDNNGVQKISKKYFIKGWYKMRVRWKFNNKEFYSEENFNVQ